ncbi:MAG: hypothetical protein ABSB95_15960, partial [Dissulfurispiraceae bacterium]
MPGSEIKSIELAKELNLKPSEVVKLVERIRGVEFKKGTSRVNITAEEATKIRAGEAAKAGEPAGKKKKAPEIHEKISAEAPRREKPEGGAPKAEPVIKKVRKVHEPAPAEPAKPVEIEKEVFAEITVEEETIVPTPPLVLAEDEEEAKVPDRFKKEIEVEKVEKIKVKPTMQKAFQAIKKIEPKKWVD